jgi:hypothetical protein
MPYRPGFWGGGSLGDPTLFNIISFLNLDSGLNLCLDAGDEGSYPGSGQTWVDTSGEGNDFILGSTASTDSSDPTFNGSAGGLSAAEYWTFDGSNDLFQEASGSMNLGNWQADGAKYTLLFVFYGPSNTLTRGLFDDGDGLRISETSAELMQVSNEDVFAVKSTVSAAVIGDWNLFAISCDENGGATGSFLYLNGEVELEFNAQIIGTPGADDPGSYIIGDTTAHSPFSATGRLAMVATWNGVNLSAADLDEIYEAIKADRFPTLP